MKKIKIFTIFILISLFLTSCGSNAIVPPDECFETDGETITKYDFNNEKCPTNIIIPEKIREVEITKIGNRAFIEDYSKSESMGQVVIEKMGGKQEIIKLIQSESQENHRELKNLYQEARNSIKDDIQNTKRLTEIYFSDNIEEIGREAFAMNDLKKVVFGANLKIVGKDAFTMNEIKVVDFSRVKNPVQIESRGFMLNYIDKITLPTGSEVSDFTIDPYTHIIYE